MVRSLVLAVGLCLGLLAGSAGVGLASDVRCADYDRDGVVSLAEVLQVADRFGTYPGSPPNSDSGLGYEGRFDLNKDRAVSIGDILIAAIQAGEGCP